MFTDRRNLPRLFKNAIETQPPLFPPGKPLAAAQ